jgi:hypothetical protein
MSVRLIKTNFIDGGNSNLHNKAHKGELFCLKEWWPFHLKVSECRAHVKIILLYCATDAYLVHLMAYLQALQPKIK